MATRHQQGAPMGLETRCVVAVDVGGTVLKGAVVDSGGKLILERRRATHREAGVEAVVATVVDVLVELAHEARRLTLVPCAAGLVVPGVVDEVAGIACYSANLGWRDLPLRDLVQAHLDLPLAFGHDVRAGGLAEAVRGAGRAGQDLLFLALGTGIAGALILRGEPYLGVKGLAGEIGHVQVESHGPPCPCGARGCLERVASAAAIEERFGAQCGRKDPVTAAEVLRLAESGHPLAKRVLSDAVEGLAQAVTMYVSVLAPELVVLGGGLAQARPDMLLAPLEQAVRRRLTFQQLPRFVSAELGDAAGCLGAALLAWRLVGVPAADHA